MREKAGDAAFQLALLDEAMFNFHRYFFIMPTLARFEFEVFSRVEKPEPLNADILDGIMGEFLAEGYGSTLRSDPERSPITWAQFLHLYMPYYTFQYSMGISVAHAMAEGVIAGDEEARQRYLNFLRAGSSQYPLEVFRLGGIDMTSPEPVEKVFGVLDDIVSRLETFAP